MRWQDLEREVRKIAESVWSTKAEPENVADIRCDTVLKIKKDYWILIEISKRDDLNKLRDDVAKLNSMKQALLSKRIYSESFFITSGDHTSLRGTGEALDVEVHSLETFASKFIGSSQYIAERSRSPFGSAVDPDTGTVDEKFYTPIRYFDASEREYTVPDITNKLKSGKKIVLMGEFGSGKSRCIMEIFRNLIIENSQFPPLAINLRESYGVKKFNRLIADHLDILGLGEYSDNIVRSVRHGQQIILLDGFDEIGVQPLGELGLRMFTRVAGLEHETEKFVKYCCSHANAQVGCDFVAAKVFHGQEEIDFRGFSIYDGRIKELSLVDVKILNLSIGGVEIEKLVIEGAEFKSTTFTDCMITVLKGASDLTGFPEVFISPIVGKSEDTSSVAKISELNLTNKQKTLLAILKKLFFQKGRARQEEALLRGAEKYWDAEAAEKAIQYMVFHKIITRDTGRQGNLYAPQRKYTRRIEQIMKMQNNSKDDLWLSMN